VVRLRKWAQERKTAYMFAAKVDGPGAAPPCRDANHSTAARASQIAHVMAPQGTAGPCGRLALCAASVFLAMLSVCLVSPIDGHAPLSSQHCGTIRPSAPKTKTRSAEGTRWPAIATIGPAERGGLSVLTEMEGMRCRPLKGLFLLRKQQ